ncbi:DENN (AEX-3) domain [Nesidiocoris tenuis]|uniref:DENN (AEX-3) domain n=1 Tax=Nesidiocoris tenuis TaxID=355587 RepID=A0ABN7BEB3_9HEMI|nr:DENN (AEX-3) domain [Nesidiocoris tenuis]
MERRRVAEIKKRFEDGESNPFTIVDNINNLNNNTSSEIRRRQLLRNSSQPEFRKTANGRSPNGQSARTEEQIDNHVGEKPVIKRTPAFRSSRNEFASVAKAIIGKNQPKRSPPLPTPPLPTGPAPKKPPRTFAHVVANDALQAAPEASKTARFKRSRTEPLIMLKRIESALKKHQNPGKSSPDAQNRVPPPRVENVRNPTFGTFQLANSPQTFATPPRTSRSSPGSTLKPSSPRGNSRQNGRNVYDLPFDDVPPRGPKLTPPTRTQEPLYSEPCLAKSKSASPPVSQPAKSLYYMSTPILVVGEGEKTNRSKGSNSDECLRKMQTLAVDSSPVHQDPDSDVESIKEIKQEVVEERKIYAKRVSSMRNPLEAYREVRTQRLMDVLLLVGIDNDVDNGKVAYVKSKYPYNADIPDNLKSFVFPDAADWPPTIQQQQLTANHNNYTIALTSAKYERTYAYCRRLQPEGSSVCLPLAYAIVTPHKANNFYYKILEEIENNHGLPEQQFKEFVRDLYNTDFPPDENQSIRVGSMTLNRMKDSRKEGNEISELLKAVGVQIFLRLLSSMLSEKKIILLSSNISLLSDSVEGLLKSLYPFEWPHTVLTVVPHWLFEILESPAPYIAGVIKNEKAPISASLFKNIEHVLVVDVDKGQILTNTDPRSDPVIPEKLVKALSVNLYLTPVNGSDIGPSEALIRLFVQLVGHYRNHLVTELDSYLRHRRTFQKEAFIKAPSNKGTRQFLEWFTDTFLFQVFIHEKLERGIVQKNLLFDQRCAEYIEETVCKKSTTLNKAVKNLGERFKDWTS